MADRPTNRRAGLGAWGFSPHRSPPRPRGPRPDRWRRFGALAAAFALAALGGLNLEWLLLGHHHRLASGEQLHHHHPHLAAHLELDSELLFVGDGGATEASRPSRRTGIEWTNFWEVNDRLTLDFDLTLTDSEFTDADPAGDQIPGAIERTVAAGIAYGGPGRFSAGLRWRYFGDVPLIEDGSVTWSSASLVNARLGYRFGGAQPGRGQELRLEIFNLLDREDSDVEYFYPSRLPGEPLDGVEDVHFHPMPRRSVRLVASWRY